MTDPRNPLDPDRMERSFTVEHVTGDAASSGLRLAGRFSFADAGAVWSELRVHVDAAVRGASLDFQMGDVERVDGGIMALLAHLRAELQQRGVKSEFQGAPAPIQEIIHLYRGDVKVGRRKKRRAQGTLDQIGKATMATILEVQLVLAFLGSMVISGVGLIRSPQSANWKELTPTMERTGADAVPIILLVNFLVGLVMAFQASVQLKQFGANIFVADLIGISMTRELGPLMTAIVICGRSGAAFAAELGSMKVNEEIDALRTMGFGSMRFLVLPRTLALMLVMPILTLLADLVGIIGGLIVGLSSLDLTITVYFTETQKAVKVWDVYSGLIKSMLFALAIALISCQQGLATTGGAEGVGRRTTSAVVTTLFTLIMIDAIYTVLLRALDL
jgi:phospholipid/cholesterol/gamma-HCH transport system permease protein